MGDPPGDAERGAPSAAGPDGAASETPLEASLAPPAARWLHRTYLGSGVATFGLAAATAAGGAGPLAAVVAAAGALHLGLGLYGLRAAPGAQRLAAARDELAQGRAESALHLVGRAERRHGVAAVRRGAQLLRAEAALEVGDRAGAVEAAARAATPSGRWESGAVWLPRVAAAAVSALAHAERGDAEASRADLDRLAGWLKEPEGAALSFGSGRTFEAALARTALAEGLLLSRSGERDRLREHLERHRSVLANATTPRERRLVRSLEANLAAAPTSPYRRGSAKVGPADLDAALAAEEAARADAASRDGASTVLDLGPASRGDLSRVGRTGRGDWSSLRRIVLLVGAFVVVSVVSTAINFFPIEPAHRNATFLGTLLGPVAFMLGLLAYTAGRVSTQAASTRALLVALTRHAAGGDEAPLRALLAAPEALLAAQAGLALARAENRAGRFEEARVLAEAALQRLQGRLHRTAAAEELLPALAVERAVADAALGNAAAALREVDALPLGYAHRAQGSFSVRLVALVTSGHRAEALALVRSRPSSLPLEAGVEALAELVRGTVAAPDEGGGDERRRLSAALGADEDLRRWLDRVAPELVEVLIGEDDAKAPSPTGLRIAVGPVLPAPRPDEDDVLAEEEAAALGHARPVARLEV